MAPPERETPSVRAARWLIAAQHRYHNPVTRTSTWKRPKREPSIRDAAKMFKCGKSQLGKHVKSIRDSGNPAFSARGVGRPMSLTAAEDDALEGYLMWLIESGSFPGRDLMTDAANRLRARRGAAGVSRNWYTRWKRDHPWYESTRIKPVEARRLSAEQRIELMNSLTVKHVRYQQEIREQTERAAAREKQLKAIHAAVKDQQKEQQKEWDKWKRLPDNKVKGDNGRLRMATFQEYLEKTGQADDYIDLNNPTQPLWVRDGRRKLPFFVDAPVRQVPRSMARPLTEMPVIDEGTILPGDEVRFTGVDNPTPLDYVGDDTDIDDDEDEYAEGGGDITNVSFGSFFDEEEDKEEGEEEREEPELPTRPRTPPPPSAPPPSTAPESKRVVPYQNIMSKIMAWKKRKAEEEATETTTPP